MGYSKSNSEKEVCNNTILPQETRKISNKHPNFIPIAVGKLVEVDNIENMRLCMANDHN